MAMTAVAVAVDVTAASVGTKAAVVTAVAVVTAAEVVAVTAVMAAAAVVAAAAGGHCNSHGCGGGWPQRQGPKRLDTDQ
jgi:hypothetical protein